MAQLMEGQAARAGALRIELPLALAGLVTGVLLLLRLTGLTDNTVFVDEALYALVGQHLLHHVPDYSTRWITGSYLYPLIAGEASLVSRSPLYGIRLVSVLSNLAAGLGVYLFTARLLNRTAGVLALIVFGFTGVSVLVASLATYDSMGIGFLAAALALLAYGLTADRPTQASDFLIPAGVAFALSFLSKYVALVFVPVVALLVVLLVLNHQRIRADQVIRTFVLPFVIISVGYILVFREDLSALLTTAPQITAQPAPRLEIVGTILRDLGLPALLALLGSIALVRPIAHTDLIPVRLRNRRGLVALLWTAALAFPVYHLLSGNIRSLDKHAAYALVFLAPLAGWGIAAVSDVLQQRIQHPAGRLLAAGGWIALLLLGVSLELNRGWELNHSWPNKEATFAYLATQPITTNTPVLAEGRDSYAFYFDWDTANLVGTWATDYQHGGQVGAAAMKAGLTDHYFKYLIVDGYYTPDLSNELKQVAQAAGYQRTFLHTDLLGDKSTVDTEVYSIDPSAGKSATILAQP